MLNQLMIFIFTYWVKPITLQVFVKNPSAPCRVAYTDLGEGREQDAGSFVLLVKGTAINCERRLTEHAGISHKYMFNCRFQVHVLRNLFILLSLWPLQALMASQAEFTQCSDFGCKTRIELDLSTQQWLDINQIFAIPAATALQEKLQIRQAIALMEKFTGEITGSSIDKAENYPGVDLPHQQDCIDESTNTFQYLFALQKRGWLKWHKVAGKYRRIVWFASHWTALIEDLSDHQVYAVDSWYRDNGKPPYIQKLEDWKAKKPFPITLNP